MSRPYQMPSNPYSARHLGTRLDFHSLHARELRGVLERIEEGLDAHRTGLRGEVKLHANASIFLDSLAGEITSFMDAHPGVDVRVKQSDSVEVIRSVREGHARHHDGTVSKNLLQHAYSLSVGSGKMSIQMLSRYGVALFLVALVSGCSWFGSGASSGTSSGTSSDATGASGRNLTSNKVSNECKASRKSCLYNGQYEPGERNYAEQEAKRLNVAEIARLRRAFGN